jgi:uncharacterized membrane protein YeaQ/YmgE (transglycosylase-associated protein family)
MQILFLIVIGAAAGFIATRLMRVELDLISTIVVGAIGAGLGWLALRLLFVLSGWLVLAVGAVLGAMLVTWAWARFFR